LVNKNKVINLQGSIIEISGMSKIMTLEVLSSIKGAEASDAVAELFGHVKNALVGTDATDEADIFSEQCVPLDQLRDDIVVKSSERERKLIAENFPAEKKGYLVVMKVIED
jgi:hypothetical protein